MGKHNGKARTSGARVGSALVNKAKKVPCASAGLHAQHPPPLKFRIVAASMLLQIKNADNVK